MTLALLLAALLFLVAAAHPFTTYPLSLWIARRWHRVPLIAGVEPEQSDTMALCLCAFNEQSVIREKIENLLALKRAMPGLDIYAYVDGATDRTADILLEHSGDITVVTARQRRGKTHGMNHLVKMTQASIVVFTDANVLLRPDALENLRRYFTDPSVGCVCGHLQYVNPDDSLTATTGSLYWRLEEVIKQYESDTGSAMGADGSIFAIRRQLHRPVPVDIIDDMYVSLSILCDGYRIVRAPDVVAYERSAVGAAEEFRRKVRIACQAFNVHRLLWPRLRRLDGWQLYKYLSHKFLRWISIYSLAIASGLVTVALWSEGLTLLAAAGWLALGTVLLFGERTPIRPLAALGSLLTALAGAGVGVWKSLAGERFRVWTPASSARRAEN